MSLFENLRKFARRRFEQRCGEVAPGLDGISFPSGSGRSPAEDRRIAAHESGHAVVARAIGAPVRFVTIEPGNGYEGIVLSYVPMKKEIPNLGINNGHLVRAIRELHARFIPEDESKVCVADWIVDTQEQLAGLVAGIEAEKIIVGDAASPAAAGDDYEKAKSIARSICSSDCSALLLIEFARSEARTILSRHQAVLQAATDALLERRTLDGEQLDEIISAALARESGEREKVRRASWFATISRAAEFERETSQ